MPKQYLENKLGHKIQYDPDGKKYRVGAYKAEATGSGKLPKGSTYYWMHRVEELELNQADTSFDPANLE